MKLNEIINKKSDIIWYHGSNNKFDAFSPEYLDKEDAYMQEGPGYYLTSDINDARAYGPNILKFKIKINKLVSTTKPPKPILIQNLIKNSPDLDYNLDNWGENKHQAFKEAFTAMMSRGSEKEVIEQVWYDFYRHNEAEFIKKLAAFGYTGLLIPKNNGVYHFILYDLNALIQI